MVRPMKGEGSYDRHNEYQMRAGLLHSDLVATAASKIVPDVKRGSVVLVDYGCAQGRVSNPLIRLAIDRVRSSHRNVPVQVYHNDLLTNDWAGPDLIEVLEKNVCLTTILRVSTTLGIPRSIHRRTHNRPLSGQMVDGCRLVRGAR